MTLQEINVRQGCKLGDEPLKIGVGTIQIIVDEKTVVGRKQPTHQPRDGFGPLMRHDDVSNPNPTRQGGLWIHLGFNWHGGIKTSARNRFKGNMAARACAAAIWLLSCGLARKKLLLKMPSPVVIWLWLCAYLNCVGWTLSALHQMNPRGYAITLALGLGALLVWQKKTGAAIFPKIHAAKLRRRFRRAFPAGFLILATLAFLGGALYAPTNYDALAYRLPRVLHWLADGQWHWIHSIFDRLNNRSCGIEWVSAPLLALLKTDRLLFLINVLSFLLLPGLVFSVFTRLGVRARVAWPWMWLIPSGYCFVLQAGSIGNDLFGTVFALAAVDFALRTKSSGSLAAFFTSVLAAALMTSAKTNNLPLLLPWAVALLPSWKILFRRPLAMALIALLAAGASGIPTIYFNLKNSGDWSGARLAGGKVEHAMAYRTAANVVSLTLQNTVPPVFPVADKWNQTVKQHLPPPLAEKLGALIEYPGCWFPLAQMQMEENAGLGFGLTLLFGISVLAVAGRRGKIFRAVEFSWPTAVRWASAIAFLALLTQANISAIGRLFAAYYILPLTIFLSAPGHEALVRQRWWRWLGGAAFLLAAGLLVISPARPLFPRDALLAKINSLPLPSARLLRMEDVYSVYRNRNHAFAPALAALPPETKCLGFAGYDKPETSLWQPFGARRVIHVCPGDDAATLKRQNVRYLLLNPKEFPEYFPCPLTQWLLAMNAVVVQKIPLRLRAAEPPQDWLLIQLD